MEAKKSRKSLNPVNPDSDNSHKKGTFLMQKHCTRLGIVVLISMLAVAITGCDDQMTNQIDRVINTDVGDDTGTDAESTQEPVAPLPAGTAVFVEPRQTTSPAVGRRLTVRINVKGAADVLAYEVTVGFDPTALRYVSITNADYLPAGAFASPPQTTRNSVYMAATSVAGTAAAARGTLATVTFEVVSAKASTITLNNVLLSDSNVTPLALKTVNGKVVAP